MWKKFKKVFFKVKNAFFAYNNAMKKQEYISLLNEEINVNSLLANSTAYINDTVENLNWVGYYLSENETLYLHTFQGKVACSIIPFNKGVCGHAATTKEVVVVPDVHQFPGHISCDANSKSEIVLPIIVNGNLYGVLDIDSPIKDRFDAEITEQLKEFAKWIETKIESLLNK